DHQLAPGEGRVAIGSERLQRLGYARQRLAEVFDADLARLDANGNVVEGLGKAAQRWIRRQSTKQWLGPNQLLRRLAPLLRRKDPEAVLLKERTCVRSAHTREKFRRLAKLLGKGAGGGIGELGGDSVDDDHDRVGALREGRIELQLALPP